jgi:23S rRNA pseudouridine955/2504/2580 synthase
MPTDNNSGVRRVTVDENREGQRVDNFLSALMRDVPRSAVYRMIRTGQVRINGKRCKPASRLKTGDEVRVPPARTRAREDAPIPGWALEKIRSSVLHQDADLLVVDKPAGMAVHSGSGLAWGLIDVARKAVPGDFLELVHRLDRETSGCLLLARNGPALKRLSALFRDGQVEKFYLCLLDGRMVQEAMEVDAPLSRQDSATRRLMEVSPGGKPAITRFRLLQAFGDCSYAEAELLSGRTHQIRAHALHAGMPLAGDEVYGNARRLAQWRKLGLRRFFLHAHRLVLVEDGGATFESPLPDDLRAVLDKLETGEFLR